MSRLWNSGLCILASICMYVQAIRSLPEQDDLQQRVLPSRTLIARDNLLAPAHPSAEHSDDDDDDEALFKPVRVLGNTVYTNVAPFLRVKAAHEDGEGYDLFSAKEDMRVHPQDEAKLVDLACIALDLKEDDPEEREAAVGRAAVKPDKVRLNFPS